MVYIDSWDEFVERSIQLFRADPQSSRYVMKYRHCDGKLVLKVTDDRQEQAERGVWFCCFWEQVQLFQEKQLLHDTLEKATYGSPNDKESVSVEM